MSFIKSEKNKLAEVINNSADVSRLKKLKLVIALSIPAIVAQVSAIIMQYIDASMVGSLGANPAASIGLVSTSTWIFFGLCSAASVGFSVQVAHLIGASKPDSARNVFRQSLVATLIFSIILAAIGVAISGPLPHWLGGEEPIVDNATIYFRVTLLAMPVFQLSYLAAGMLRCSGNMVFPGMAGVLMCVHDVVFNFFLIFPTREIHIFSLVITVP
ncbi:MAG: MATE family efflux transporter, partial [Muribaculaceae bacterium]|nr:MATE family efflux transporter [Muribaculaceae bacterium]